MSLASLLTPSPSSRHLSLSPNSSCIMQPVLGLRTKLTTPFFSPLHITYTSDLGPISWPLSEMFPDTKAEHGMKYGLTLGTPRKVRYSTQLWPITMIFSGWRWVPKPLTWWNTPQISRLGEWRGPAYCGEVTTVHQKAAWRLLKSTVPPAPGLLHSLHASPDRHPAHRNRAMR